MIGDIDITRPLSDAAADEMRVALVH